MCMCVCICISHMYTFAQTRIHTIHLNNIHPKRHMCTCSMIHTNTLTNGRSCSHVCMDMCTCVYVCYSMYMYVCIYIAHLHIDAAVPCTMHVCNVHAQRHICTCTTIHTHTHTRTSGRSCSRVYMDLRTCVYVCHKCTWACMCIHTSISHIYILTQTRIHTIYAYNMHGKRPMYTCTMIHTYKHTHERPLMQSYLYGCVYLCISLSQCVCMYACMYLYYTSIR